jgi:VWFA-related protein
VRLAFLTAALTAAAIGQATQPPTFKSTVAFVRLDVSVADDRGPIRGLRVEDFTVTDSGTVQKVSVQEFADAPLDAVVVAQPLRSIGQTSDQQVAPLSTALSAWLGHIEDRDRIGVLTANAPPTRVQPLQFGKPALNLELFNGGRDAAVYDTITAALGEFVPTDRRQVLVVFANGTDFRSTVSFEALAEQARRLGPAFVLIGAPVWIDQRFYVAAQTRMGAPIGSRTDVTVAGNVFPATLRLLARRTGGVTIDLGKGDPRTLMKEAIDWMRTRYVVSYEMPPAKGWHPVTVRVKRGNAKVVTREGYTVD